MSDGSALPGAASARPVSESTLDELLADPIVQQLMRRDQTNESVIRHLLQEVGVARPALRSMNDAKTDDRFTISSNLEAPMDNAYVSAIAALAGSAIGALASFATTWLTQHAQERSQRFAQAMARREHLFGEFIDEASRLFTDALTHEFDDPSKFVCLYALVGKLRLFASANVISRAEEIMGRIAETYRLPNVDLRHPEDRREHDVDLLRAFSEACREELGV